MSLHRSRLTKTLHRCGARSRIDRWRGMGRMPIRFPWMDAWSTVDDIYNTHIAFTRIEYGDGERLHPYERHAFAIKSMSRGETPSTVCITVRSVVISTRERTNERRRRRWLSPSRASLPPPGASLSLSSLLFSTRSNNARHRRIIHRSHPSIVSRAIVSWACDR